jgi:riboflavin synthase alpha subunit
MEMTIELCVQNAKQSQKTNLLERGESIHDEGISLYVVAVKQDLVDVEAMGGDLGFSVVKTKQ